MENRRPRREIFLPGTKRLILFPNVFSEGIFPGVIKKLSGMQKPSEISQEREHSLKAPDRKASARQYKE